MKKIDNYETVTELPGNLVHAEQLKAIKTRYGFARRYVNDKIILEVACGSGIGLGILEENAKKVVGGDIDKKILEFPKNTYKGRRKITLIELDVQSMPFNDNAFGVVICFEAIYYFPSILTALSEINRVLSNNGSFIGCSVNPEWHGFNPSPYSIKYYNIHELRDLFTKNGFIVDFWLGFNDDRNTMKRLFIAKLRAIAANFGMIPKSMKGKEIFKRIFYGPLRSLPRELKDDHESEFLIPYRNEVNIKNYKVIYFNAMSKK